jgi:hypothetical protein
MCPVPTSLSRPNVRVPSRSFALARPLRMGEGRGEGRSRPQCSCPVPCSGGCAPNPGLSIISPHSHGGGARTIQSRPNISRPTRNSGAQRQRSAAGRLSLFSHKIPIRPRSGFAGSTRIGLSPERGGTRLATRTSASSVEPRKPVETGGPSHSQSPSGATEVFEDLPPPFGGFKAA